MKKLTRILSAALIAALLLSLSAAALAELPPVFIPAKLSKLGLPDMLGWNSDYTAQAPTHAIYLKTKTESKALGRPCPIVAVEDADIDLTFSPVAPDWAGVVWSNGWEDLVIDGTHAETSMEGHPIQPGMWASSGPCIIDPETGKAVPAWYVSGGDYPYSGGKTWDDGITVNYNWTRKGKLYKVEYVFENEDFFRTGMEGAKSSIVYECVNVELDSGKLVEEELSDEQLLTVMEKVSSGDYTIIEETEEYTIYQIGPDVVCVYPDGATRVYFANSSADVWYVSQVKATYPAGNDIVAVEADYRNDRKGNLASYRISYPAGENEMYKITYAPKTTSVLEDHIIPGKVYYNEIVELDNQGNIRLDLDGRLVTHKETVGANAPSGAGMIADTFVHHYTEDEPIYGEYYVDGALVGVSGSGNKLNKWYKPGHGKQIRKPGLKGTGSFTSPRVE